MECYKSSIPVCVPFAFSEKAISGFRDRMKGMIAGLRRLTTPEPTDLSQLPPDPSENRIFGAIKALFWTAVSIGMGSVLAMICR